MNTRVRAVRNDQSLFLAAVDVVLHLRALAQIADASLRRGLMAAAVEIERMDADNRAPL